MEKKDILIVDDMEINRAILSQIFADRNQILEGENGLEAVQILEERREHIAAVLIDILMPVMDGCKAAETIRSLRRPDAKTVPIIAVTANVFAEDIARTTQAGMNAHIAKPIDFKQLQSVLKDCLDEERHSAV